MANVHGFQKAGLGLPPYNIVRVQTNDYDCGNGHTKPGGTCDYCYTGIRYEYVIRSADGNEFIVGSTCVDKVDPELKRQYGAAVSKQQARDAQAVIAWALEYGAEAEINGRPADGYARWAFDAHLGNSALATVAKKLQNAMPLPEDFDTEKWANAWTTHKDQEKAATEQARVAREKQKEQRKESNAWFAEWLIEAARVAEITGACGNEEFCRARARSILNGTDPNEWHDWEQERALILTAREAASVARRCKKSKAVEEQFRQRLGLRDE